MKENIIQNSFNSGELSPLIEARSDLSKYASGCRKLENAIPLVEGGAKKMPGSYFVISTKYPAKKSRLVPFSFSTIQTYILEFGDKYIRVFKDDAIVVDGSGDPIEITTPYLEADLFALDVDTQSSDILYIFHRLYAPRKLSRTSDTAWTLTAMAITGTTDITKTSTIGKAISNIYNAEIARVEAVDHGFVAGDRVYISGVAGMVEINQRIFTVSGTSGASADFNPGSAYTALSSNVSVGYFASVDFGGGRILYVSMPYDYYLPMPASISFISNPDADVLDLDPTSDTSTIRVMLANATPSKNSAEKIQALLSLYVTENEAYSFNRPSAGITDPILGTFSTETAGQFLCIKDVSSSATNTNHFPPAESLYWGTSGLFSTDVFSLLGVNSQYYNTYLYGGIAVKVVSLFNSAGNYPSCGSFYEQRLMLAGSDNHPLRVNGSVQGDYENFISDPNAIDYAIQFDILSGKQDRIRWMMGQQNLMLGSVGGVWSLTSGSGESSLTQVNVDAKKQISTGVGTVHPQLVNDTIIWITRSSMIARLLQYNWSSNQWIAPDLTRVARHITKGASRALSGITQTAFQSEPYPLLWSTRADGQLLGMTFESQEQVYAWFRIVMDGVVESVACKSQDNDEDEVWMIVNRTINGATCRYVEYFKPQEIFSQIKDAFFVHCGLTWDGGSSKVITGISQGSNAVVTSAGHGFTNGMLVQITGVVGMTEANQEKDQAYTVANRAANTFELSGIDASIWTAYASGGIATRVTNTLTNLGHLEGKDVVALGDGAVIYEGPVVGGTVTFNYYSNLIHIGLPFITKILPMNPNIAVQQGTSRGKKQKINKVTLCFHETVGCRFGMDEDHLFDVPFGKGIAPELFTGDITRDLAGDWDDKASIAIVHDKPFPFTLKAVIPRLSVNDD